MNKLSTPSPADDYIRYMLALAPAHQPSTDLTEKALAIAHQRQQAATRQATAFAIIYRLWLGIKSVAIIAIIFIIGLLLWMSANTGESTSTAQSATSSASGISNWTVSMEWMLVMGGLVVIWLVFYNVCRALSDDNYDGVLV